MRQRTCIGFLCGVVLFGAAASVRAQQSGEVRFDPRLEEAQRLPEHRVPPGQSGGPAAGARMVTDWRTGYDMTEAEYDLFIAQCVTDGFRPVSVVARDDGPIARFTVVAHQDGLSDWVHVRGLSAADMTDWADARLAEDYEPVCIAAQGTSPDDLYTAVMVRSGDPRTFLVQVGLTGSQYGSLVGSLSRGGRVVLWLGATGVPGSARFAVIAANNAGSMGWWTWWGHQVGDFEARMPQAIEYGFLPATLAAHGTPSDPRFSAMWHWRRTEPWEMPWDISVAEMQQQESDLRDQGFYATTLTIYQVGDEVRCAGVFVKHAGPRTLTITGMEVPELAALDQAMVDHIMACDIFNAALAVVKDGRLVLARAYTYAPPGWPTVAEPDTLFRIASMSKPMCSVAMHQAAERGSLGLDDLMVTYPNLDGWTDSDAQSVTLRYLLQHRGGWNRNTTFDPVFYYDVPIADYLGKDLPISLWDIITYMKSRPFQFVPGTQQVYSNLGFLIDARALESVDGRHYEQIIRQDVHVPLNIYRARMSEWTGDRAGETRYLDGDGSRPPSVMSPEQEILDGYAYGGYNHDNTDAAARWIFSVVDYARFLRAFDDPDNCPLLPRHRIEEMWAPGLGDPADGQYYLASGWIGTRYGDGFVMGHNGRVPGGGTVGYRLETGEIYVVFQNCSTPSVLRSPYDIADDMEALIRAQQEWPDHDLFPTYCASDFNRDRVKDSRDLIAFLNGFAAGDDWCDLSGDGTVNTIDVIKYLNLYNAGCD